MNRGIPWLRFQVGGKMAVIRLADGTLWVHSPVHLDEPLRLMRAVGLGPVGASISSKDILGPRQTPQHIKSEEIARCC